MKYNLLGKTDLKVSELGFGASPFGNIYNRNVSNNRAKSCVERAIDKGVNYFDVAPYYGLGIAEEKLGKALPKNTNNLIISTKIGRYGVDQFDFSIKRIKESIETSLKRLNRDYVDLLICHDIEFVSYKECMPAVIDYLSRLKKSGVIRAIGVSGFPLDTLRDAISQFEIDVVLSYCKYTLLDQSLLSLKLLAEEKQIGIINASPFAMGLLTQENCPSWHPFHEEKKDQVCKFKEDAKRNGKSIEEIALKYAYQCPIATTTLAGFSHPSEVLNAVKWLTEIKDN